MRTEYYFTDDIILELKKCVDKFGGISNVAKFLQMKEKTLRKILNGDVIYQMRSVRKLQMFFVLTWELKGKKIIIGFKRKNINC